MKKAVEDAGNIARSVLFGVDAGWHERYWYCDQPASYIVLGSAVQLLVMTYRAARSLGQWLIIRRDRPEGKRLIIANEG